MTIVCNKITGSHVKPLRGEPDERLSPDEALEAFTVGASYAAFSEREVGRFAVGQRADFTLFKRDPRSHADANVEATYLDGVATTSLLASE